MLQGPHSHNSDADRVMSSGATIYDSQESPSASLTVSPNGSAFNYCIRLLSQRDYSRQQLIQKLTKKGYDSDEIHVTCDRLESLRYVDDVQYAKMLLSTIRTKFGTRRVRQTLEQKGIGRDIIDELLEEADSGKNRELACEIAAKRWKQPVDQNDVLKAKNRLYRYLLRRGFSSGDALFALEKVVQISTEVM